MGHLFSRAFKRLTQSGHSRNQLQTQEQQQSQQQRSERENDNQNRSRQPERCYVESIPIGQSIDSAECRAILGTSDTNRESSETQPQKQQQTRQQDSSTGENVENNVDETSKQDVEDAVIKIQALVRGHLTRKALKDAQHHSLPSPNALGQRQFDEDSLTKNPPSAVFLPTSPLNMTAAEYQQNQADRSASGTSEQCQAKSQLESIAEVTETNNNNNSTNSSSQLERDNEQNNSTRKKPSCVSSRSASSPSKLEMPTTDDIAGTANRSLSPALSDAGASIDLGCTTPASASIIISDHNIKPADKIATVLHAQSDANKASDADTTGALNTVNQPEPTRDEISSRAESNLDEGVDVTADNRVPPIGTPDSLESEEAAAIRIQSAFRGYRTRKNSPYRTRSPTSSASAAANKRNALRQQEATEVLHENDDELNLNDAVEIVQQPQLEIDSTKVGSDGRRLSRTRHRDSYPDSAEDFASTAAILPVDSLDAADIEQIIHSAPSIEEFTTTEDTTTVKEAPLAQQPLTTQRKTSDSIEESEQQLRQQQQQKEELLVTVANSNQEPTSISLDIGVDSSDQLSNTLDEVGLTAALVSEQPTNNDDGFPVEGVPESSRLARPSLGGKSEASVELDTDSSVLGAALSLNEDISVAEVSQDVPQVLSSATTILLEPSNAEDQSQGPNLTTDEVDSEVQQYGGDYITNSEALTEAQATSALEEATDQLEAALEEATEETGNESQLVDDVIELVAPPLLDEDEQRAIEEESDDIERRDPSGQVSEERAISPQIRTEPPDFEPDQPAEEEKELDGEEQIGEVLEEQDEVPVEESVEAEEAGSLLAVNKQNDDAVSSGRSSRAGSSSDAGDSSSDHEKNPKQASQKQNQQQQQQQQQVQSGKNSNNNNNKKKNRKRKGKK